MFLIENILPDFPPLAEFVELANIKRAYVLVSYLIDSSYILTSTCVSYTLSEAGQH